MNSNLEFFLADPSFFIDNYSQTTFDLFDIFINPSFMKIHAKSFPVLSFGCVEISSKKLLGLGHFANVQEGVFRSPGRGTYGGLQFNREMEIQDFLSFASYTYKNLVERGAKKIEIALPPTDYNSCHVNEWLNAWFLLGFKVDKIDLNYAISLDQQDYNDKVVHAVRKRINKCRREDYRFFEQDSSKLPDVYEIIKKNRESKGFPVTMTLDQLQETMTALPGKIRLFTIASPENMLVASAVVYEVNPKVSYVFYWGDLPGFSDYSFVTFLSENLYALGLNEKKQFLDLGISTVNSVPNPGLVKFKVNLGATASSKFVISKEINTT